jgi:hypothetical protein
MTSLVFNLQASPFLFLALPSKVDRVYPPAIVDFQHMTKSVLIPYSPIQLAL